MRGIDIYWTTADVQLARPDLTEDQAWEVLMSIRNEANHRIEVNWDTIGGMATWLYPEERAA
jgi:hypothetical protein